MIWLVLGIAAGLMLMRVLHIGLVALKDSLVAIDSALTELVAECQLIVPALDGVPALAETQALTGAVPGLVKNYVGALTPLL
jgi:hypothetical protein